MRWLALAVFSPLLSWGCKPCDGKYIDYSIRNSSLIVYGQLSQQQSPPKSVDVGEEVFLWDVKVLGVLKGDLQISPKIADTIQVQSASSKPCVVQAWKGELKARYLLFLNSLGAHRFGVMSYCGTSALKVNAAEEVELSAEEAKSLALSEEKIQLRRFEKLFIRRK